MNKITKSKKSKLIFAVLLMLLVIIVTAVLLLDFFGLIPKKIYYAEDFGITESESGCDYNGNGVDDYTDILLGARKDAENHPKYDGSYVSGGYPADNIGVCTDVVWRAFKNSGYSLRDMVDNDIKNNPEDYPGVKKRDNNIDFRRVVNLKVYFEKYADSLTLDPTVISNWQAGDIVIFGNNAHIGIISDKRNKNGITYVIHNAGQPKREEDYLSSHKVTGHYRFNPKKVKAVPFK